MKKLHNWKAIAALTACFAWLLAGCGQVSLADVDASFNGADVQGLADLAASGDAARGTDTASGGNKPPTVKIKSPANDAVFSPGQVIHFAATVFDDNDSPDLIKVTWKASGQVIQNGKVDASGFSEFDYGNLPGGTVAVVCEATDTQNQVGTATINLLINTPPGAPAIEILPKAPTTADDLTVNIVTPATDPDRTAKDLSYTFEWFKNGQPTGEVGKVLSNKLTAKGDTWKVAVKAHDPKAAGPEVTAQVQIGNSAPVAPSLAITPTTVDLQSTVACNMATPATDADGDKLTYKWTWTVNDFVTASANEDTVKVQDLLAGAKQAVKAGDLLKCAVVVTDGQSDPLPKVESPQVAVQPFDVCASTFNPCDDIAKCENTTTLEPICTCPSGYFGDGKSCFDSDECLAGDKCSANALCTNSPGSFSCKCKAGFVGDGATCTDVDECKGDNGCDLSSDCSNTQGSYVCACKPGFGKVDSIAGTLKCGKASCADAWTACQNDAACKTIVDCAQKCSDGACWKSCKGEGSTLFDALGTCATKAGCGDTYGFGCADIDECKTGAAGCDLAADCSNSVGGFKCTCKPGFEGDGKACNDVNECLKDNGGCSPNAECQNFEGGRFCICKPGFLGTGEVCNNIDECAPDGGAKCDANAICADTPGSYTCTCKPGYSGDGKNCADIDECAAGTLKCHSQGLCINTQGSANCVCKPGYSGDGKATCDDVDQCATGILKCGTGAVCVNQPGPDVCNCDKGKGYVTGDPYVACYKNTDPCVTNNGGCSPDAICTVAFSAATCKCKPGFTGDGKVCTDINECTTNNGGCATIAVCTNTPGSFTCGCKPGYSGDGKTCTDINECAANNGGCSPYATCTNAPGSFSCKCNSGFTGDGKTCTDNNECLTNNGGCAPDATCSNTPGGNTCACKAGFIGDGKTCTDINECLSTSSCDPNALCTNLAGSYKCTCKTGYSGDGKTCADTNECAVNNGGCASNATCTNSVGSYSCACKAGFTGDPKVACTDIDECPQPQWLWDFSKQGFAGWAMSAPSVAGSDVGWKNLGGVLYYGNAAGTSYDSMGQANKGTATGPAFTFGAAPGHRLVFDLNMNTEGGTSYDKLTVLLNIGTAQVTVWDKSKFNNQMGVTQTIGIPLTGYAGKTVQVQFLFDTGDGAVNATAGVKIFNVKVLPQTGVCDLAATCANTVGSYTCKCDTGLLGDGKKCGAPGSSVDFAADSCLAVQNTNPASLPGLYYIKQPNGAAPAQLYCEYGWTRLSLDTFDTAAGTKWTPAQLTTCGGWGSILGGYGVTGANAAFTLLLSGLPAHNSLRISGTYYCIDSWDGENAQIKLDDALIWQTPYKSATPAAPDVCGMNTYTDVALGFNNVAPHTKTDAKFVITSTLDEGATNEAFGVDNVAVWYQ